LSNPYLTGEESKIEPTGKPLMRKTSAIYPDEATKAVTDMPGKMLAGKPIYITLAKRKSGMMGGAKPMIMPPGMQQGAKYCYGMNQSSKEKQGTDELEKWMKIDHNIAYRNALKANKAAVVKYSTLKLSSGEWPALGK
jgi:hypothetical protein